MITFQFVPDIFVIVFLLEQDHRSKVCLSSSHLARTMGQILFFFFDHEFTMRLSLLSQKWQKNHGTNPEHLWSRSTSCVGGVSPSAPTGDCTLSEDEATALADVHETIAPTSSSTLVQRVSSWVEFPVERELWPTGTGNDLVSAGMGPPTSMPNTTRRALLRGPTNSG